MEQQPRSGIGLGGRVITDVISYIRDTYGSSVGSPSPSLSFGGIPAIIQYHYLGLRWIVHTSTLAVIVWLNSIYLCLFKTHVYLITGNRTHRSSRVCTTCLRTDS